MKRYLLFTKLEKTSLSEKENIHTRFEKTSPSANTSNNFPVAINLEKAITSPGSDDDILLREGDILSVPLKNNIVKISGEVMYPVSMTYEEGRNLKYYIKNAGGYRNRASKSRIYGIYANGHVSKLKKNSAEDIQPGMEIVVPQKKNKRSLTTSEIVGIGSGVAAICSIIVALLNTIK